MPGPQEALSAALDSWNAGDLDGYLHLYDEGIRLHGYSPEPMGKAQVRGFYEEIFSAFDEEARVSGGGIHHRFAVGDGFVLVVDEWESAEHFGKFFANPDLQALVAASGAAPQPPEITIAEAISSPDEY